MSDYAEIGIDLKGERGSWPSFKDDYDDNDGDGDNDDDDRTTFIGTSPLLRTLQSL